MFYIIFFWISLITTANIVSSVYYQNLEQVLNQNNVLSESYTSDFLNLIPWDDDDRQVVGQYSQDFNVMMQELEICKQAGNLFTEVEIQKCCDFVREIKDRMKVESFNLAMSRFSGSINRIKRVLSRIKKNNNNQ